MNVKIISFIILIKRRGTIMKVKETIILGTELVPCFCFSKVLVKEVLPIIDKLTSQYIEQSKRLI